MRIIDLFDKLMNDEKMPKRIKLKEANIEFVYVAEYSDYQNLGQTYLFSEVIKEYLDIKNFLKEEIEIIEK